MLLRAQRLLNYVVYVVVEIIPEQSASPYVYVVVIILFPSFISSDSGASDCAVPVVIYFGERWREGGCLRQKIL